MSRHLFDANFKARLIRIGAAGEIDRRLGQDGQSVVKLGTVVGNEPGSLAIDARGRILLGATLATPKGRSILLAQLSAGGRQEMDFDPNGRVATAVPGLVSSTPATFSSIPRVGS